MSWETVLNVFHSDDLSDHYNGLYASYLDDIVMESEWGERLRLSGADGGSVSRRPTWSSPHRKHFVSGQIPTILGNISHVLITTKPQAQNHLRSFFFPFLHVYTLQLLLTLIKIHLLFKSVWVSLGRPRGTSRGVGALGGGEHSLFFMLWVKTMRVWAGLVIWWELADFQGTRWGLGVFSGHPKLLVLTNVVGMKRKPC